MSDTLTKNPFAEIMAAKSDEALHEVVNQHHRYEFEACIAAFDALERRHLLTPELSAQKLALIETEKLKVEQTINANEKNKVHGALDLFRISRNYLFTPLLVYTNVIVFIIMVMSGVHAFEPSVASLIKWGGNLRGLTLNDELWRLFTSTFLHGGLIHLLFNMFALLQVGSILEPNVGKGRFIVTYVATGIIASISSIAFNDGIVSVGASGAIFGIDGMLLSLLITKQLNIPEETRKSFLTSTLFFIGYNLVLGFSKAGIDNAAHIGGLVSGFVIGFIYNGSLKRGVNSNVSSAVIAGIVCIAIVLSPQYISNKAGEFQKAMEIFGRNEEQAMWMYRDDNFRLDNIDEQYKNRLKTEGIDLWSENLTLLNGLTDMPDYLQQRIDLLKQYCELRKLSCKAMQEYSNDAAAEEKLTSLGKEIEAVIQKLQELNQ